MLTITEAGFGALPGYAEGQPLPSLAPMLERAMPAVVNIATRSEIQVMEHPLMRDPFFRHFFEIPGRRSERRQNSLGSGVIIDRESGYVLTNNHVIDKADEILVTLKDGRQLNANLVGTDPESDVAVIQIPAKNLTELPVADSSRLRVGDFVVAIGNPFGLGQTVTSGIISALGRSGLGIEGYEDFIQTDASINPGNSGGALVNLNGELIGINTAIIAPSGGNVGIGFAIPANMALQLMSSLVKHGEVRRGLLGVSVQDLSPDLARAFDLDRSTGAVISRVQAESPAEQAGLETGDIILAINGRSVANSAGVRNAIGLMQVGDQVELEVIHEGRKIARSARIAKPETVGVDGGLIHPTLSGTRLSMTAPGQGEGVLFSEIIQTSYPWAVGLRPGDIIINANNYRIRTLDELQSIAAQRRSLLIRIQRDNEAFIVHLQ
ncbi:MAG: DegQ family serine endoprotease [Methylococcaceae bacterium]|nr:DegQ family serine endoprotease [Methylococcaceae bacterium]MCI0732697.1 DegQ family serine endoprotease [Methylococcaceae bacterium]